MDYKTAWDYQERLLRANTEVKTAHQKCYCRRQPTVDD